MMSMRPFADFNGTPGGGGDWLAPSPPPWGPQFLIDTTNTVLDISVLDGEHFVFPGLGVVTRVRRVGGV